MDSIKPLETADPLKFVVLHCGAGYNSPVNRKILAKLGQKACLAASNSCSEQDPTEACVSALCVLEDCPLTNAGRGSNITRMNTVECDASLVLSFPDGSQNEAAVGAMPDILNPIRAAQQLLQYQSLNPQSTFIPPNFLVGSAARDFASAANCLTGDLFTESSRLKWTRSAHLLQPAKQTEHKDQSIEWQVDEEYCNWDTVGAITVSEAGVVTVACSSGGISLKHSGRVGPGATIGAGAFVDRNESCDRTVAVVCSGAGEFIMKTQLARELTRKLLDSDSAAETQLSSEIVRQFLINCYAYLLDFSFRLIYGTRQYCFFNLYFAILAIILILKHKYLIFPLVMSKKSFDVFF